MNATGDGAEARASAVCEVAVAVFSSRLGHEEREATASAEQIAKDPIGSVCLAEEYVRHAVTARVLTQCVSLLREHGVGLTLEVAARMLRDEVRRNPSIESRWAAVAWAEASALLDAFAEDDEGESAG